MNPEFKLVADYSSHQMFFQKYEFMMVFTLTLLFENTVAKTSEYKKASLQLKG
jgi:hypothetical protein